MRWTAGMMVGMAFAIASCSDDASTLTGRKTTSGTSSGDTTSSSGDTTSSGGDTSGGTSGTSGASGASGTSGTSGTTTASGAAQLCVDTINKYRATKGLPPYARWTEIEACSDGEALADGNSKRPHGSFPKCGEFGQNECPGWPGPPEKMIPECLKAMWGEGPGGGHYEAMASTKYTKVACGFATVGSNSVWAVQNFK